jgi:hypothetical protein
MSLSGMACLISRLSRQGFALSFLYAHVAVCFILYFGGLLQTLSLTADVIRVIGWVSLVTVGLQAFIANPSAIRRHGSIFLLVMITAFYLQTLTPNYYSFTIVDDYSHWGAMSRTLALHDRLVISSDPIGVKDYPPGLGVIHYLYTSVAGFRDSLALFAQGVFVYACLAVPFQALDRNSSKFNLSRFIILALSSISLSWIFSSGLHTLQADLPVGLLFGLVLWIFFSSDGPKASRIIKLAPLLLCTVLLKQIGLVFVLIALLIMVTDVLFAISKNKVCEAALILALFIAAIAIDLTWKAYLGGQGMQRTFQSDFSMIEVFKAFIPKYSSVRQKITIDAFIHHFVAKWHFTSYWILLSIVVAVGAYKSSPKEEKRSLLLNVSTAYTGLFLYLALLLVLYMFSFSEFEGTRLASINRYTNTYLLGLLVGFGGIFAKNIISDAIWPARRRWIWAMALLFIVPYVGRAIYDVLKSYVGINSGNIAVQIRLQADRVNAMTPNDARIYFLWAGGTNDESVIFNYGVYPRTSNGSCSNIRPKGVGMDISDPWACSMELKQFEYQLADYDYLFVGRSSDELNASFLGRVGVKGSATGNLFAITGAPPSIRLQKVEPKQ